MKKLIVNADDFGLHPLINAGIIKGYREGFITSTSLMPSAPCWQEAVKLAQENPQLGIGVHLTNRKGAGVQNKHYAYRQSSAYPCAAGN